jgi:hypothetical protein
MTSTHWQSQVSPPSRPSLSPHPLLSLFSLLPISPLSSLALLFVTDFLPFAVLPLSVAAIAALWQPVLLPRLCKHGQRCVAIFIFQLLTLTFFYFLFSFSPFRCLLPPAFAPQPLLYPPISHRHVWASFSLSQG